MTYEAAPVWYAGPSTPELCVPEEPSGRARQSKWLGLDEDSTLRWLQQLDESRALNAERHLKIVRWLAGEAGDAARQVNVQAARLADELMADVPWYEWPDDGYADLMPLWETAAYARGSR
jgi:hypothetical protein